MDAPLADIVPKTQPTLAAVGLVPGLVRTTSGIRATNTFVVTRHDSLRLGQ